MNATDRRHLEHAQGWLGLGNWQEANAELEEISPAMRAHPEALRVRCGVYALAKKWDGAYEIARTLCRAPKAHWQDAYNLARAACQVGRLKEAYASLQRAIELAGREDIRLTALNDATLEPLWVRIGET